MYSFLPLENIIINEYVDIIAQGDEAMPQLILRGVDPQKILAISSEMLDDLQKIIGCPRGDLTLECLSSTFIADGQISPGYPFVEIAWFDRGQEMQDQVALAVTQALQRAGYESVDIMFTPLAKSRYYENGQHY